MLLTWRYVQGGSARDLNQKIVQLGHTFVPFAFKSALAVDSMGFPSLVVVLKMRPFFLQLMAEKNYAPL